MDKKISDSVIVAKNLSFTYDDGTKALKNINLNIPRGRKIAFLGANGSGKSTFFLCLNGIHKPQSGMLYFNNKPYDYTRKGLLDLRSRVGIVFQDPDNQLFSASVYQEISFGILNLGMSKELVKQSVDNAIKDLEITSFKDKPTHFLSGGQKKQVSIADILVMNPDVIILDEPSAALDPKHTIIVNELINKLFNRGITVIISTHDVNHAFEWADHVILFHDGNVLATGKPDEIFTNKKLLNQTNLEQPYALELFNSLQKKGILDNSLKIPHNITELESYIENLI